MLIEDEEEEITFDFERDLEEQTRCVLLARIPVKKNLDSKLQFYEGWPCYRLMSVLRLRVAEG